MSREIDINTIRTRPRFKIRTRLSKEEFTDRLRKQFQLQNHVLGGYIGQEGSVIRLRKDKREYWAPQLQIRIEKDENNPEISIVRGLFGPRSAVWTFFIFLYIFGGTFLVFFGLIWFVQMRLDIDSSLIIGAWVGILVLLGTYAAAQIGHHIAREHMLVLREFMEKVVNDELETTMIEPKTMLDA